VELGQVLSDKRGNLLTLPSAFESELMRLQSLWKQQPTPLLFVAVTTLLSKHADEIFPNARDHF